MTDHTNRCDTASLDAPEGVVETLLYAVTILLRIFSRKTYNSATRAVLTNQIYFTSVQILPLFLIVSVLLGTLFIGMIFQTIKNLGLDEYLGTILIGFVVTELSPFVFVLLIALRSGSAINTEIAVMKVNKELFTLSVFGIDVIDYLFVPRILNGVISLVLLSGLFSIILVVSGFLFSHIIFDMEFSMYASLVAHSVLFSDMAILLLKCTAFGFCVTFIPILYGMKTSYMLTSIPVSVLQGMIRVFAAIITVEVLSLIARFI